MKVFAPTAKVVAPPIGWSKAVRMALGISLQQLAKKLSVTKQSVLELERRERQGGITIKSLRELANALDMELVYGFVPKDGSLDALIEKNARALAKQIVARASVTMQLEDQQNTPERIETAIAEHTEKIKRELPKILWD